MITIKDYKLVSEWKYIHDNKPYNDECIICKETIHMVSNSGNVISNCKHAFHLKCINKWLKIKKTCPICHSNWNSNN